MNNLICNINKYISNFKQTFQIKTKFSYASVTESCVKTQNRFKIGNNDMENAQNTCKTKEE